MTFSDSLIFSCHSAAPKEKKFEQHKFFNIALTKNKLKESLQYIFVVSLGMVQHKTWCST